MSADVISSMMIDERPEFPDEISFHSASALGMTPIYGVPNKEGVMLLQLPPKYDISITAQSNADYLQLAKIMNFDTGAAVTFRGRGENDNPMTYKDASGQAQTELKIAKVSEDWRTLGLQFAYKASEPQYKVPRIRDAHSTTVGHDIKVKLVSEDSVDADFNDTVIKVNMTWNP